MAGDSPQRDSDWAGGLARGSRVSAYRIEAQAGAGGMAVVYRAHDERLGRTVALKVLAPALAADAGFRQRFIRESRAAAAVDDPHILPVYEAGEADGVLFIAMRFVSGGDLRSLAAREDPMPAARAAAFIFAAASALDTAHAAGLVHRDVKPANMLVDTRPGQPDHLYLSDFGLSKGVLSAASASLTGSAEVFGTPDYLAPEQASSATVDGRADQYALACVAFTLLAGVPVFKRDHPMAVLLAHMSEPPPPLTALRPDLPSAVNEVLAKALAKDPTGRYSSCGEFAVALTDAFGLPSYGVAAAAPGQASAHPALPEGRRPDQVGVPADRMGNALTLTAFTKAARQRGQSGTPAAGKGGHPITAAITAPGGPGLAGRDQQGPRKRLLGPDRRRATVAAAIVAAVCLAAVAATWAALGSPGTHRPLVAAGRKPASVRHASTSRRDVAPSGQGPTTGASPSPSAPPAVTRVCNDPVWPKCSTGNGTPEPQLMLVEPTTMWLSGDGTLAVIDIVWQNWGSGEAIGTGLYAIGNCIPDCADESYTYETGKILLTDLVPYDGGMAYNDITLVAPANAQPTMGDYLTGETP